MHPIYAHLPAKVLEAYADAIKHPRLIVLAARMAHARRLLLSMGWPAAMIGSTRACDALNPWPSRESLACPRVIVDADGELTPERLVTSEVDFVIWVRAVRGQPWLSVDIAGSEHVSRSGLFRRLRAGIVGPLWA